MNTKCINPVKVDTCVGCGGCEYFHQVPNTGPQSVNQALPSNWELHTAKVVVYHYQMLNRFAELKKCFDNCS